MNGEAPRGLGWLLIAETTSAGLGFAALVILARRLGPGPLARVEFASAVAAVMLVVVRGGIESIAIREAARRPRLIARWTGILLGVKLVLAVVSFMAVLIVAVVAREQRATIAAAGLVLFPSALLADLGPRASGRLGVVALAQIVKASSLAMAAWILVKGPDHATLAAACATVAEAGAVAVLAVAHVRRFGWPRWFPSHRVATILIRRGIVASVSRLGRVFLFAADVLALGTFAVTIPAGPYLAARRVAFALAALGLVVPSALAPTIARAWVSGQAAAREAVGNATARVLAMALPASVGLALTADGWIATLFGDAYRDGGLALAVLAARLPLLLIAATDQAALIAVRREATALRLVLIACGISAVVVPIAALRGPIAAGVAMFLVEGTLAAGGWVALQRLGIAPPICHADSRTVAGCVLMASVVVALRDQSVWLASPSGALAYAVGFGLTSKLAGWRFFPPRRREAMAR